MGMRERKQRGAGYNRGHLSVYYGNDSITRAMPTIDYTHSEIHGGGHYHVGGYSTMSSGGTLNFVVTAPTNPAGSTKWVHLLFNIGSDQALLGNVYSSPVGVSAGTAVTPVNSNRNFADSATLSVTRAASYASAGGTPIDGFSIGVAGVNPANPGGGGSVGREAEIIFAAGATYMYQFYAPDGGTVSYRADWYEHTNTDDDDS
jgi:hypothetical protein